MPDLRLPGSQGLARGWDRPPLVSADLGPRYGPDKMSPCSWICSRLAVGFPGEWHEAVLKFSDSVSRLSACSGDFAKSAEQYQCTVSMGPV